MTYDYFQIQQDFDELMKKHKSYPEDRFKGISISQRLLENWESFAIKLIAFAENIEKPNTEKPSTSKKKNLLIMNIYPKLLILQHKILQSKVAVIIL